MKIFKHKYSGHTLTDVLITKNFVSPVGRVLYSYRYDDETDYRTVTENQFWENFSKGVVTTDGYFIDFNTPIYISSILIQSYSKVITLMVDRVSIDSRYNDGNIFKEKQNAIKFFDNVVEEFPGYIVNIKDSED